MRIEFDWDPVKETSNRSKHGVAFEEAMEVFADPLALSRLDEDAPIGEERWITLGHTARERLLLVAHTHVELSYDAAAIRIISARVASRREARQYERGGVASMREEYDFTGAERGRFYRKDAVLAPPIHLQDDILAFLMARARDNGSCLDEVVNGLLREDIARLKAAG